MGIRVWNIVNRVTLRTLCGTNVLYDTEADCGGGVGRRLRVSGCAGGAEEVRLGCATTRNRTYTAETTATGRPAAAAGRLPSDRRFRYPSGGGGGDPEPVACAFRVRIFFPPVRFISNFFFSRVILDCRRRIIILCEAFWRFQYKMRITRYHNKDVGVWTKQNDKTTNSWETTSPQLRGCPVIYARLKCTTDLHKVAVFRFFFF